MAFEKKMSENSELKRYAKMYHNMSTRVLADYLRRGGLTRDMRMQMRFELLSRGYKGSTTKKLRDVAIWRM